MDPCLVLSVGNVQIPRDRLLAGKAAFTLESTATSWPYFILAVKVTDHGEKLHPSDDQCGDYGALFFI